MQKILYSLTCMHNQAYAFLLIHCDTILAKKSVATRAVNYDVQKHFNLNFRIYFLTLQGGRCERYLVTFQLWILTSVYSDDF